MHQPKGVSISADPGRPSAIERQGGLQKGSEILRQSDESALSIVPSHMSSRFSTISRKSYGSSTESSHLVYQELNINSELFTARVYKRNYRTKFMRFEDKARESNNSDTLSQGKLHRQKLKEVSGYCVWFAKVDHLTSDSEIVERTIEGPSIIPFRSIATKWISIKSPSVPAAVGHSDSDHILREILQLTNGRFDEWKRCLLYEACKQGRGNVVSILLDHNVWIDDHPLQGNAALLAHTTPLHVAVWFGHLSIAEILLRRSKSSHPFLAATKDRKGRSCLHLACDKRRIKMVQFLVANGAPLDSADEELIRPLHIAARYSQKHLCLLNYLLDCGADVNAQTRTGYTPLHFACLTNSIDKVETLLAKVNNLSLTTKEGFTPLHLACRYGSLELIQKLLWAKAPLELKTTDGRTPLHIACTRGVLSVVDDLSKSDYSKTNTASDPWPISPLVVAVFGFNYPIVSRLLSEGFDVDFSCHETGKTVLQEALSEQCFDTKSQTDRRKTIETLLSFGADAHRQDHNGNNVLHHWVLGRMASPSNPSSEYWVRLEESQCQSLLNALIEKGADILAKDLNDETPLDLAPRLGPEYLLRALNRACDTQNIHHTDKERLPRDTAMYSDYKAAYAIDYPEVHFESFTNWKAGTIPRHEPPDERYD